MAEVEAASQRDGRGSHPRTSRYLFYRHALPTRLMHWVNAIVLLVLLMSGLQIFNAHPSLYLGRSSNFDHPTLALAAVQQQDGTYRGVTHIGPWHFSSTGLFGASEQGGEVVPRGFPSWATLPSGSPNLAL